jgi:hypothetical protein
MGDKRRAVELGVERGNAMLLAEGRTDVRWVVRDGRAQIEWVA